MRFVPRLKTPRHRTMQTLERRRERKEKYTMGFWCPPNPCVERGNIPSEPIIVRRNECRSWSSRELPSPIFTSSAYSLDELHSSRQHQQHTILKLLSSSLICCASIGVNRLQVAISDRRSYSWPVQVSWNTIRGLNVAFRLLCPEGVPGALLVS